MHLLVTVLGRGFRLVEALQRTVVSFVQSPVANDRNPHLVHLVEDMPQSADGAFQYRRVGDVELVTHLGQQFAGSYSFLIALFGQVHVRPAREQVLEIPVALPVTAE